MESAVFQTQLEKVQTCTRILEKVCNEEINATNWNYGHVNVLVLCLEALAFQDMELKIPKAYERGTYMRELACKVMKSHDFELVKEWRTMITHSRIMEKDDYLKMIRNTTTNTNSPLQFFVNLKEYFEKVAPRLLNCAQGNQNSDWDDSTMKPLTEFVEKPDPTNIGKPVPVGSSNEWKTCFNALLEHSFELQTYGLDMDKIEKTFYDFTITAYLLITEHTSKKAIPVTELKGIKEQRGEFIHRFYETCYDAENLLDTTLRYSRMHDFLKDCRLGLFKIHLAVNIYTEISQDGHETSAEKLDELLDGMNREISTELPMHWKIPTVNDDALFGRLLYDYMKLMVPVDNEEASKQHRKPLSALDRRYIYEEFIKLRDKQPRIETEEWNQDKLILENKINNLGINSDTFEKMFYTFFTNQRSPEYDPNLGAKLDKIRKDFWKNCSDKDQSVENTMQAIPVYRKLNCIISIQGEQANKQFYEIKNIHEKFFGMTNPESKRFYNAKQALSDPNVLEFLLWKIKNLSPDTARAMLKIPCFAPLLAQLRVNGICSFDCKPLEALVKHLLSLHKFPEAVNSLGKLIGFKYPKNQINFPNSICGLVMNEIVANCLEMYHFVRLLYVQQKRQEGGSTFHVHHKCIETISGYLNENTQDSSSLLNMKIKKFLELIKLVVTHLYQNESDSSKFIALLELIDKVIESKFFNRLDDWDSARLETMSFKATIQSKIEIKCRPKFENQQQPRSKLEMDGAKVLVSDSAINDLRNLYDAGLNTSQLQNDHHRAYKLYKYLSDSILIRCNVFPADHPSTVSAFKSLEKTDEYQRIVNSLDYWTFVDVQRSMAFELREIAESYYLKIDAHKRIKYFEEALKLYEEIVEMERPIPKTLKEYSRTCLSFFCKTKHSCTSISERVKLLDKALECNARGLEIERKMYEPNHRSVLSFEEFIRKIKSYYPIENNVSVQDNK